MTSKLIKLGIFLPIVFCISCTHHHQQKYATLIESEKLQDHSSVSHNSMVVTQGPFATEAGLVILAAGGNAVDAAVAVSLVISVERPQSTGIGGGGFALVGIPGSPVAALDFRERAPENSKREFYLGADGKPLYQKSQDGSLAVATPGLIAGLYNLHLQYGKLPWKKLFESAIELAQNGFTIYPELAMALDLRKDVLKSFPSSRKIFFHQNGDILKKGDLLIQSDLAKTLKIISNKGKNGFYYGSVAKNIIDTIKKNNGILTLADLRKYRAKTRTPVSAKMGESFQNVEIFSMPPPSSGGIHLLQILNMVEEFFYNQKKPLPWSSDAIHYTALAMQQAFFDRAMFLGDPDFVKIPTNHLISKNYAKKSIKNFSKDAKLMHDVKTLIPVAPESTETTHFSIIDKDGMSVSSTQTINGFFGSGLVAENTGIVLNNEMDDFSLSVGGGNLFGAYGGEKNFIQPFKTPLSSMSPTIVMKNGKPLMILGSPSGTRIITCVALTILNHLFYQMPLSDAVSTSRYHQQWSPDELWMEKEAMTSAVIKDLEKKGHRVKEKEMGCKIQAIVVKDDNSKEGFSDIRGRGLAKGN